MRVIVAGSRSIHSPLLVARAIEESGYEITELVSGGAGGVDRLGENWARNRSIPVKVFYAAWDMFGRGAGFLRNHQMAQYADALIAIWDGVSKGTEHMIKTARMYGLLVYVVKIEEGDSNAKDV